MITEQLSHKLILLPDTPGCYIMKDDKGEILYVGKAKVLKNRVRSYFHGVHNNKTTKLVSKIRDFEFIQTSTEKEALLLEINLIKKHRPPFNIMFMDDKMYPYIEVSKGADFTLRITRKVENKKNDYFGPFPVSTYAYDMVKILNRIYPIRKCRNKPKQACLYYHMHQCLGWCVKEVNEQEGLDIRRKVVKFLRGNPDEILDELRTKMEEASENLQFERAAEILEEIRSIQYIVEKQTIDFSARESFDAFGWYEDKGYISFQGFFVRDGKLTARNMSVNPIYEESVDAFVSYLLQYYQTNVIPSVIYVPDGTPVDILEEALNTKVHIPQRKEKKKLVDLAVQNAKEAHDQKFQLIYKRDKDLESANHHLSRIFKKPVHTVEIFDNSHISGAYNVSGLVVFKDGKPDKKQYRKYQLKEYKGDTESMKEVVYRRYFRLLKEGKPMPDLLIVDGGPAQIHAAAQIRDQLQIDLTIAGLVKDDKHNTRALLDENLTEIPLDKQDPLFFLLTRMQDEVHRFAISYHQKLRAKGMTKSVLDDIPGIGPSRKKVLNDKYPTLKKLRAASLEDLKALVPASSAELLYERLHQKEQAASKNTGSDSQLLDHQNSPNQISESDHSEFQTEALEPGLIYDEETGEVYDEDTGEVYDDGTGEVCGEEAGEVDNQEAGEVYKQVTDEASGSESGKVSSEEFEKVSDEAEDVQDQKSGEAAPNLMKDQKQNKRLKKTG